MSTDTNPFDREDSTFKVLVNAEGQHSLWPSFADVPAGWEVRLDDASRAECLAHVEANWTDMRPKSLAAVMSARAGGIGA